jgi:ubiquinone/menaquinone biosynthesis C-methylase UbiE
MKERLYELSIEIAGYDRQKEKEIKRVCSVEWPFMEGDFVRLKVPGSRYRVMQSAALGTLFEVEDIDEVIKRLERVIWHVNGELCHVECKAKQIIQMQECLISLECMEDVLVG